MTSLLLTLVLAQTPSFVYVQDPEPHPRLLHAAIAAHVIAQFADLSTTSYAMGRGGFYEHNPIMRPFAGSPVKLALVKGGYAVGTSYLFLRLHRTRPKLAFALAAGHAVFTSIIAARNARLIRHP